MSASIRERIIGWLPIGSSADPASEEEPSGPLNLPADERGTLPDGYREAAVGFEAFDSPREFEYPVPDIGCLACGEAFETYWSWFNHGKDVHEFGDIEAARSWSAVIVPTEFDGELEPGTLSETSNVPDSSKPSPKEVFGDGS